MGGSVVSCNIINNNLHSDHVLLYFNINIDHATMADRTPDRKTTWWKTSDDQTMQYKYMLENNLS